jgi:hypothetical protein
MINPATGGWYGFGPLASAEVILLDEINRILAVERVPRRPAGSNRPSAR